MDLTIKLSIVGGVVWIIAIIVEYLWYWRQDHAQETKDVVKEAKPEEVEPFDAPSPSDASAVSQKVG